ncbi:hypothetical protein Q0Z83_045310 [Actinoplanes sichuanensis]|uniref:Uncharacterized protein n=1 Tax=Actinoplanes sichuanensis TaxID=512349 RepID=A0ABW4AAC0_9ACTN|nr:hypothetical protein [Actinoplanes sichuanensis]BEL06340.1 hypothetical protein Q0Z83_045310 [Actinoplanes sichuanensis]
MTDASVHLAAQPRIDTLVTEFRSDTQRLRTDFAGTAWIGDIPDPDSGMMGPNYQRRVVDSQLFLPDTHWYTVSELDDAEIQISAGLLQVPGTAQGSQGLVGAIADPSADFFEHPEHDDRVGICLTLRGRIWSNIGLSYRITVLCRPEAFIGSAPE